MQQQQIGFFLVLIALGVAAAIASRPLFNRLPFAVNAMQPVAQDPNAYDVVDGDTISAPDGTRYRLLGYDAPETSHPGCDAELQLGKRTTARLKELLTSGVVQLTESGERDRFGRTSAEVTVNGRGVGDILLNEGLARRSFDPGHVKGWCQ